MILGIVSIPRGRAALAGGIAAACCALLLSAHAQAQQVQVSVSVQGMKGKVPKEVKGAMCRATLDFLASSFPDSDFPSDCNKKIPDAPIHLKAEGIFEAGTKVMSLLLELKNVQENAIIKQKSVTINFPAGEKPRDIAYSEMTLALKELVPSGWKPPTAAGKKPAEAPEEPPPPPENKQGTEQPDKGEPTQPIKPTPQQPEEIIGPTVAPSPEAETPAAAAKERSILLALSEKDALVSIDGKSIGKSPFKILPAIAPGTHSLAVKKEGFKDYSGSIEVPDSGETGILRQDIYLESKSKEKKGKSIAKKWWLWTIIGVVLVGGGAATAAAIVLQKDETDAIPFPGY